MQPHELRVAQEKEELDCKIEKLTAFVKGKVFESLPADECERLTSQLAVMGHYSEILRKRIAAFPPSTVTIIP
jgi:hypothetical protein